MKIKVASRLGEVKEYYFSVKLREIAQMRAKGMEVLNLGIGSPDLKPDASVLNALKSATELSNANQYQSYKGVPELRSAISDWYQNRYGVTVSAEEEVLPLIGSKEGIMHISMAFLEAGDEVLVPNPGYPTYRSAAKLTGATIKEYKLDESNNWYPDFEALEQQDLSKVKIMWVNYPNMPTGVAATIELYEQLVAFGRKHEILICNDNPYSFILRAKGLSILSVEGAKDVALELNSLSKSHNMAGWRVGMVAGDAYYIQNILRFKSNMDSGMFLPVQKAAIQALALEESWYQGLNEIYAERQQKVFELFELLGCQFDRNQGGMFVWAKVPKQYKTAYELSDELLAKANVFITPGGIFGSQGDSFIRASLCSDVAVFEKAIQWIKSAVVLNEPALV